MELDKIVSVYLKNNQNKSATAKELGIPRTTVRRKIKQAQSNSQYKSLFEIKNSFEVDESSVLKQQIQELKKELNNLSKKAVSGKVFKNFADKLENSEPKFPDWIKDSDETSGVTGVPSLVLSDWHFGEVVDSSQILECNEYNLDIAKKRVNRVVEKTIDLAFNHIANPSYPGIVVYLLGDMSTGIIHDELKITAEKETLQVQLELLGVLVQSINRLKEAFGKVFVPCVAGNHGRLSIKPRSKNAAYENLDWLLYMLLAKWFEDDEDVKFLVSDGEDAQFKIYGWNIRITHGGQYSGGDGIIGPVGPLVRGTMKKKSQLQGIDKDFDLLICGHFHRHIQLSNIICNSSLVGLNEYAFKKGFPAEPPQQAFFLTTKEIMVAFPMAILADEPEKRENNNWVGWKE